MIRRTETTTLARLQQLLHYYPSTGRFVWKADRSHKQGHRGKTAGTLNDYGYVRIRVENRNYLAHRLAWLFTHGDWPPYMIDHKNRNRADNRIKNLRCVNHGQNIANGNFRKDNSSGYRGVYCVGRKFKAAIGVDNKFIPLGLFETAEEASAAYVAAAKKYRPGFLGQIKRAS